MSRDIISVDFEDEDEEAAEIYSQSINSIRKRNIDAENTYNEEVYRIRVWEPSLRELLLFKSIYRCCMIKDI